MGLGGRHALHKFLANRFFCVPIFFLIQDRQPGATVAAFFPPSPVNALADVGSAFCADIAKADHKIIV